MRIVLLIRCRWSALPQCSHLGSLENLAGPMSRPGALALEEKSLAGPAKTPRHHSSLVHSLALDELDALSPHENDCPAEPAQSVAAIAVEEK